MINVHKITEYSTRSEILLQQIDRNVEKYGSHSKVVPKVNRDMMTQVLREENHGKNMQH